MESLTPQQEYLLLGKVSDTLSEEELKEWEQMVQQQPAVAAAFEQFIRQLPPDKVANHFSHVDEHGYWDDLAAALKATPAPAKVKRLSVIRRGWVAAAIVAGVIAGSVLFWKPLVNTSVITAADQPVIELQLADGEVINLSEQQGNIPASTAQLHNSNKTLTYSAGNATAASAINTLKVPVGLDYKITLSDGTEVWMNSATELKFPLAFSGNTREVTINGEAYLKVAKDAQRAFLVHLPNSTVQVLGTAFNVNTYDSGTVTVALVEGSVNLQTPTGDSRLTPGRKIIYTAGKAPRQEAFEARYELGWQQGLFYFDEVTLEEISKILPRWFGISTVIDNPAIRHKKFVGVLDRKQPISVFQEDLKLIAGIDSYMDERNVLHFR